MRVRINQKKLEEVKDKLRPGKSWWALLGIIFFFFVPEIAAYFYGDVIKEYFAQLASSSDSYLKAKLYTQLESLGENSIFNIILGIAFVIWFFRARNPKNKDSK